jgi:ABC-type Fe3+ transport system substrate-binding protein
MHHNKDKILYRNIILFYKRTLQRLVIRYFLIFCVLIPAAVVISGCARQSRVQNPRMTTANAVQPESVPEQNKLVILTSHKKEVYQPVIREFEARTGIWVDVTAGGTQEMLDQIRDNVDFGDVDLMFGGGVESLEAYKQSFAPYRAQDAIALDSRFLSSDDAWTPFTELPIVFIYNPKLVSLEQAPKDWQEFLDGTWKGQIAFADPLHSGTSYTILCTMLAVSGMQRDKLLDTFRAQLDGRVLNGSGDVLTAVATGQCLVGITLEESALKEIARGNDIAMVYPKSGTSALPDGCAILKNAPHPDNAEKFIDFIISEDTQEFAVESLYRRPVREHIALPEDRKTFELVPLDVVKTSQEEAEILSQWTQGAQNSPNIQSAGDIGEETAP